LYSGLWIKSVPIATLDVFTTSMSLLWQWAYYPARDYSTTLQEAESKLSVAQSIDMMFPLPVFSLFNVSDDDSCVILSYPASEDEHALLDLHFKPRHGTRLMGSTQSYKLIRPSGKRCVLTLGNE
jgi:hypothetical protein